MNPTTIAEVFVDIGQAGVALTKGDVFGVVSNLSRALLRIVPPNVAEQAIRDEFARKKTEEAEAVLAGRFLNDPFGSSR